MRESACRLTRPRRRISLAAACLAAAGACTDSPVGPRNELSAPAGSAVQAAPIVATDPDAAEVHILYLVPADQPVRGEYVQSLRDAALNLQAWYRDALGTGETFVLADPTVEVVRTEHDAAWYRTAPVPGFDPSLWFWFNVTDDGFAETGGSFYDPDDIWVFYIDAAPACGQATGGAAGVALLPANDLRGLAGEPTIDPCTGAIEPYQSPCRWVGGLGHELGHALGLPHPPGCDAGAPTCDWGALMFSGYSTYPSTYLTAADRSSLAKSPFISPTVLRGTVPSCATIGSSDAEASLSAARAPSLGDAAAATEASGAADARSACRYASLLAAAGRAR